MNMVPVWVEVIVALLMVTSGLTVVVSALGFLRLPEFFLRMHPPALAYTLGAWTAAAACVAYFAAVEGSVALYPLLIPALLALTVPVTTVVLARVSLFRHRLEKGTGAPPPLAPSNSPPVAESGDVLDPAPGPPSGDMKSMQQDRITRP